MFQNHVTTTLCTLVAGILLSPSVEASFINRYVRMKPIPEVKHVKEQPPSPIKKIQTRKNFADGYTLTEATVNTQTGEIFDTRRRDYDANNTLRQETVAKYHNRRIVYQALDTDGDGKWNYEEEHSYDARERVTMKAVYENEAPLQTIAVKYSPNVDTSTITNHQKKKTSVTKHFKDKNGRVIRQDIDFDNDGIVDMRIIKKKTQQ